MSKRYKIIHDGERSESSEDVWSTVGDDNDRADHMQGALEPCLKIVWDQGIDHIDIFVEVADDTADGCCVKEKHGSSQDSME